MNLKMKDFVLLALLTALYVIVYFVGAMLISLIGPFGDSISPGVCGLCVGSYPSIYHSKDWQDVAVYHHGANRDGCIRTHGFGIFTMVYHIDDWCSIS